MPFQVCGSDVFFEHKRVATLLPDLYATLADNVVLTLETADPTAVSEENHNAALEEVTKTKDEIIKALETKVLELETKVEDLEFRCDEYEVADGTKDTLADLRASLEREQTLTVNLREALAKSEAAIRRLKGEKQIARKSKKIG